MEITFVRPRVVNVNYVLCLIKQQYQVTRKLCRQLDLYMAGIRMVKPDQIDVTRVHSDGVFSPFGHLRFRPNETVLKLSFYLPSLDETDCSNMC